MHTMKRLVGTHPKPVAAAAAALITAIVLAACLLTGTDPVRPDAGKCREESTAQVEAAVADGTELTTSLPPYCQGLPMKERDRIFAESADDAIADEMEKAREEMERVAGDTGYEK
ncbi:MULTISPECIES: hypothetical protein [unclassified Streptomyces]|uniref:hypothetical protein n=1 Tax=unclassified Streptomyces TaxID=2593676 RepID=UPI000DAC231E|nr:MULTISPECIES: hypothetical protein [unclassified Streptomyces]PZT77543.1 hypothetical protein DNK56_30695 [Streptomyces sp. AC1-42W]PZT78502.1 hypothetical protein DNK55_01985 [Streptomyces sp. AC1-42T]